MQRVMIAWFIAMAAATTALADEQTPSDVRAEARAAFGLALPEIENYPDSAVVGAWSWMQDVEDGRGVIDPKTAQLIGLAVASQIPCEYCIYYHTKAAQNAGATEQELREAAALAAYTRHWSAVLYGTRTDLDSYKAKIDKIFAE